MYEMKPGQGSLFKNRNKETKPKAPDYQGSANVDGKIYQVAAWVKKPEGKQAYMSLSLKVKYETKEASLPLSASKKSMSCCLVAFG